MDQNRKPGVPPSKDISDLKARLGLKRPDGAAPGAAPGGPGAAAAAPRPPDSRSAGRAPACPARARARSQHRDRPQRARGGSPPAGMNPYAGMKAPQGGFDLRTIDDGAPAANVRSGGGKAVAVRVGAGRRGGVRARWLDGHRRRGASNQNTANHAAVAVKKELDGMQKTLTQIAAVMADSRCVWRRTRRTRSRTTRR